MLSGDRQTAPYVLRRHEHSDRPPGRRDTQLPLLLTPGEVASHLRCTRRCIEREIAGHHLHVVRIGRSVRVERLELNRTSPR
ncbi:hypothetical protein BA895_20520 [Humibacillus sp. DSM 29435]|nr:hypothetical protein BA895_20520 [Humibacillus sp. DSM 29435]